MAANIGADALRSFSPPMRAWSGTSLVEPPSALLLMSASRFRFVELGRRLRSFLRSSSSCLSSGFACSQGRRKEGRRKHERTNERQPRRRPRKRTKPREDEGKTRKRGRAVKDDGDDDADKHFFLKT